MSGLRLCLARAVWVVLFVSGCLGAAAGDRDRDGPRELPDRASFPLVVDALERRCATLDCHGSTARNLRLYTGSGLRLDPMAVPGEGPTTEAEYEASYRSVVGLEPEIMSAVVSVQGGAPERLTLLRKARGLEYHHAGAILRPGDSADRCVTSWLASAIDEEACGLGAEVAPPSGGPDTERRESSTRAYARSASSALDALDEHEEFRMLLRRELPLVRPREGGTAGADPPAVGAGG